MYFLHPGSSEKQDSEKGKRPLSPSTTCTSAPKQRKLSTSKGLTGNSYVYLIFSKQGLETMKVLSKEIWDLVVLVGLGKESACQFSHSVHVIYYLSFLFL